MRPPPRDCPCHSGLRYKACCAPFHDGAHEAPTPEALMRSRYAAFALGLGEYLVRTLPSTHPDLEKPRDELTRAPVVVTICHHGVRSYSAALYLRQKGIAQARSLEGGVEAWALTVDPAMARY